MIALDSFIDAVLAKTGEDLTAEQYAMIEQCQQNGKSVKDTVKIIRKM
ncbi:hypothetical protein [Escherichia coli]|uniref:Tail fiber protein n=1 Tax=Escherichia phage fEgEco12 TaxID=3158837 RepID=A0AAU7PJZ7_9CAUD|nr:hypothetical protein [Escherichia coli]MED6536229.1 hypothetical protein [Escherichia coli O157]QAY00756.1 hypothetical protein Ecwhy1_482 [Escherichia phage Ecwhy_1]QDF14138.1 hypothetical protein vBEcoMphAPEC6_gp515c [Escherichia phage vB_EcoM_phAPEC6]QXN76011.1 hypothetical protein [Escherichia phage BF17]WGM49270.1 hypothetical protein EcMJ_027 [Escherichia phage vB_Ec-M-J]WOL23074.1 hypothetical protein [Escherichia phage vB_EcoM_JNE01]